MKILVTGGSGRVGLATIDALLEAGHDVVNADRTPPTNPRGSERARAVRYIETDLSDVGQVAGAMRDCDGVIHLGAIPSPYRHADETVFANNVLGTFAVLQAAAILGISRAVIASSISALGPAWSREPFSPLYAPVDEAHPLLAKDAYALSKEVDERTAEMFHRQTGLQVLCIRFHWVSYPDEARARAIRLTADPGSEEMQRHLWGYVDIRDAAQICRVAIEAEGLGFDIFNCIAPDTLADIPTADLVRQFAPETDIRPGLDGYVAAFSTAKATEVLGWRPVHSWRDAE